MNYTEASSSETFLPQRTTRQRLSLLQATALLSSISLGLLLVTASLCWFTVGWILGIASVIIGTLLQIQSSSALSRLVLSQECYSYEDVALLNLGKRFQTCVNICLIVGQTSVCMGALYVASSSILGFIYQLLKHYPHWLSNELCILIAGVFLIPFSIAKEIKGVKAGSIINIILVVGFICSLVAYFVLNYSSLRASHPETNFQVSIWPNLPVAQVIPKITIILNVASFNPGSSAIFNSLSYTSQKRALVPAIIATLINIAAFLLIGVLGAILFGQLILSEDSLIKVLYLESSSFITPLTQLIFAFIAIYHTPVYLFTARESILSLLNEHFSWARNEPHYYKIATNFPKMYDRVPVWLFYSIGLGLIVSTATITMFINNFITFLQILGLPIFTFLNFLFPNLAIIKKNGLKKEPYALLNIIISTIAGALPFLFGIIQAL